MADTFWDDLIIPVQTDDIGIEFVNPVLVAQTFIKAIGMMSYEGQLGETLTGEITGLTLMLDAKERELGRLKRKIMAKHFKGLAKSASTEVREAYLIIKAEEDGKLKQLEDAEDEIAQLKAKILAKEHECNKQKTRLKTLQIVRDWSKQYLDFDKIIMRMDQQ